VWVALLRGINVGGHRKVPMAELRSLCEELGLRDVRTYIASGNVVCASSHRSPSAVASLLERGIGERFGHDVSVVVRKPRQLADVVEGLPFAGPEQVSVSFLLSPMKTDVVKQMQGALLNDAEVVVKGLHAYVRTPRGLAQPFLPPALARTFSAAGTSRNWRTVTTLRSMAEAAAASEAATS
jgi:uncharacterized protein (DUF1697 family)